MEDKKILPRDLDVGASKVAKGMLGSLDRRLIDPAGTLIRFSGWVMIAFIAYITFVDSVKENERVKIFTWLIVYSVYLVILEIVRKYLGDKYDTPLFRSLRVGVNLIVISCLVGIAPSERHLLIFAYCVPIFASVVYFAENIWAQLLVFFIVIGGMTIGHMVFNEGTFLHIEDFLKSTLVLVVLSVGFDYFRRRVYLMPSSLTELAREMNKTLDLQQLMEDILTRSIEITQAQRGVIIVIDPRNKKYVGHKLYNFQLNDNSSIEELAKKCFVLVNGKPFDSTDMMQAFKDKSIYYRFFGVQPRSLLAEPLFNRTGEVIGVINVAHNDANGFEKISKNLLHEFAFLVSNSIENCFEHRQVVLSEAKSRETGTKYASADSEDDVIQILIDETRQQVLHAEKITLHKYKRPSISERSFSIFLILL